MNRPWVVVELSIVHQVNQDWRVDQQTLLPASDQAPSPIGASMSDCSKQSLIGPCLLL
jgi:hypothetical protein